MAFCSNCGTQCDDGQSFCPNCGQALNGAVAPQAAQPVGAMQRAAQERQESLQEMRKMMDYFGQKRAQYDRYDQVTELIARYLRTRAVPLLVWGIIIAVSGLICVASLGAGAIPALVIGLGMIGGFIALNVDRKKKLNAWYEELSSLASELQRHYENYGFCLVGMEYSNPSILGSINQVISVGRADTPKEAINVLLDDVHKNSMEMMAEQTMVNSAAAARGASVSAGFAAASFFLK